MPERPTVSQAIQTMPMRFDMFGILGAASQVLRARAADATLEPLDPAQLQFFIERGLVSPPSQDGSRLIFDRRQLLQICAVQALRGAGLDLERIATLMQGAGDEHLRLLCDEPEETAKKAAVMHNWMQMLDKGRYSRADRGGTSMMHQPEVELPSAPPPSIAPRPRVAPASPGLDVPASLLANKALSDPAMANQTLKASSSGAARQAAEVAAPALDAAPLEFELPDAPPPTVGTVANAIGGRVARETVANSELQRISEQLAGMQHGRTMSASIPLPPTPAVVVAPAPQAAPPAATVPVTPVAATPVPATPVPATPVPATPAPARPTSRDEAGRVWRRYSLAPGVELHVEDGPNGPRPRDPRAVLAILERLRQILG